MLPRPLAFQCDVLGHADDAAMAVRATHEGCRGVEPAPAAGVVRNAELHLRAFGPALVHVLHFRGDDRQVVGMGDCLPVAADHRVDRRVGEAAHGGRHVFECAGGGRDREYHGIRVAEDQIDPGAFLAQLRLHQCLSVRGEREARKVAKRCHEHRRFIAPRARCVGVHGEHADDLIAAPQGHVDQRADPVACGEARRDFGGEGISSSVGHVEHPRLLQVRHVPGQLGAWYRLG